MLATEDRRFFRFNFEGVFSFFFFSDKGFRDDLLRAVLGSFRAEDGGSFSLSDIGVSSTVPRVCSTASCKRVTVQKRGYHQDIKERTPGVATIATTVGSRMDSVAVHATKAPCGIIAANAKDTLAIRPRAER
jgi:hypothetical protein